MNLRQLVWAALAVWFAAVFAIGAAGGFAQPPGVPPLRLLAGFTLPIAAFLAAYYGSRAFRELVLGADLRLLTAVQGWRAGGLGFLALYTYGVLPGLFAWPAGLGDIALGLTAPWVASALARDPAFAGTRRFAVWNLLGILDLVVAVSMGALGSGVVPGLTEVLTTPMAGLPLVLIPTYFVPIFVVLHLAALFQARRAAADQPARYRALAT
jgi:hypothetical protein